MIQMLRTIDKKLDNTQTIYKIKPYIEPLIGFMNLIKTKLLVLEDNSKQNINEEADDFEAALQKFLDGANKIMDEHNNSSDYNKNNPEHIELDRGSKYIRLIRAGAGQRSALGFIDKTNGAVLKAAGWKTPAKNFARGNIYDDKNGTGRFYWTGIS